jgi:adenylylsulfate kinase
METVRRSIVKTISYRLVILILDFITIYLFTGKIKMALGFTIVSNIYTTVGYFLHERIWDKIKWGKTST